MVSILQARWFGVALHLFLPSWILGLWGALVGTAAQELQLFSWLEHYYLSPASWIRQLQSEESSDLTWSPLRTGRHSGGSRQVKLYRSRSYTHTQPIAVEQLSSSVRKAGQRWGSKTPHKLQEELDKQPKRKLPRNTSVLKEDIPLQEPSPLADLYRLHLSSGCLWISIQTPNV